MTKLTYTIDQLMNLRHINKTVLHNIGGSLYSPASPSTFPEKYRLPTLRTLDGDIRFKDYTTSYDYQKYMADVPDFVKLDKEMQLPKVVPIFDLRKLPPGARIIRVRNGEPVPPGAIKVPPSAVRLSVFEPVRPERFSPVDNQRSPGPLGTGSLDSLIPRPYSPRVGERVGENVGFDDQKSGLYDGAKGDKGYGGYGGFGGFNATVNTAPNSATYSSKNQINSSSLEPLPEESQSPYTSIGDTKSPFDSLAHQDDDGTSTIGSSCDSYNIQIQLPIFN